jgi:drug/metabolite transporter (DMT)-like permease
MNRNDRIAVAALTAAGLLWGTTVPVTKAALEWLPPGWLTVVRFGVAAVVLLAAVRFRVRAVWSPAVLAWGAVGYGGSILVQNAGITRTSVTHAALLIGATPVLVAVIAAVRHRRAAHPVAWTGFAASFAGVGLVAAGGGGGATVTGDGLVLASLVISASLTVAQARLLPGRDPVAVSAVQFLVAALATLPVAAVTEGVPAGPGGAGPLLATAVLVIAGTLAPFTLFAYGQARVSAETAGAFVNLEPLVGAVAGAVLFGDPVGLAQAVGGAAILAGIALSSVPLLLARAPGRPRAGQHPHAGRQRHRYGGEVQLAALGAAAAPSAVAGAAGRLSSWCQGTGTSAGLAAAVAGRRASDSTGGVNQWPRSQPLLTCSTGPPVDAKVQRSTIVAGAPQAGSGQAMASGMAGSSPWRCDVAAGAVAGRRVPTVSWSCPGRGWRAGCQRTTGIPMEELAAEQGRVHGQAVGCGWYGDRARRARGRCGESGLGVVRWQGPADDVPPARRHHRGEVPGNRPW